MPPLPSQPKKKSPPMVTLPLVPFVDDEPLRVLMHVALQITVPELEITPPFMRCVPPPFATVSVEPDGIVRPDPLIAALFHVVVPVTLTPLNVFVPPSSVRPPLKVSAPVWNVEWEAMG